MSLFNELKRRNVFRVATAYVLVTWLVIQIAETIFPLFGFDETPARIVVVALAIGFIPTLIFAWVFEITPEGLKKEKDIDRSQSISPHTVKKLDRMIMVVLALALGYFGFDKFVLAPQREATQQQQRAEQLASATEEARQEGRSEALVESYGDKSIAVLPFVNMSDDAANEYFSDGISEELLKLLTKIPELRVISRTSAFSFKGKDFDIPTIAQQLNVAHILEGSVRKDDNQVRISVQLIEARSDTHLWSETYERTLDDIFATQDEIAATVVEQLKITLLGDAPTVQATDPQAYALVLQARYLGQQVTPDALEKSIALFEQALAIDPAYAAAWAGLARGYTRQAGQGLRPFDEAYTLAREAASQALALDPAYVPAHISLASIARSYDRDFVAAARHYQRALAIEPANTDSIAHAASMAGFLGRLDQAIALAEYAIARDPVSPIRNASMGLTYYEAGRLDEAIASFRTTLTLSPGYIGAQYSIGTALLLKGEPESALAAMQNEAFEAWRLIGLVMAHHALGQAAASDAALAKLIEMYEQEWAYNIAYVLAFRGEADRAFEWLNKAVAYNDPGLAEIATETLLSNIHDDPRWLPFLESIGKSPDQLAAIEFNVTLPK